MILFCLKNLERKKKHLSATQEVVISTTARSLPMAGDEISTLAGCRGNITTCDHHERMISPSLNWGGNIPLQHPPPPLSSLSLPFWQSYLPRIVPIMEELPSVLQWRSFLFFPYFNCFYLLAKRSLILETGVFGWCVSCFCSREHKFVFLTAAKHNRGTTALVSPFFFFFCEVGHDSLPKLQ